MTCAYRETRAAQADLAREYGVEGFCYYHYWFAGRRILERPFEEVLHSGEPDFPFCLCWANHSWNTTWQGTSDMLIEQDLPRHARIMKRILIICSRLLRILDTSKLTASLFL